jgi:glycosyltransferase involved in cell wall biosynthesis
MYKGQVISISIPMFNEEKHIEDVLIKIPDYVDYIFVVDDGSTDKSVENTKKVMERRSNITLIQKENEGVGSAILTGHNAGLEKQVDILVVVNGDDQMDTNQLHLLLDQIITNKYDFAKGNRLKKEFKDLMPKKRRFGNRVLSFTTKPITGYWKMSDALNGYTCVKSTIFVKLNQKRIRKNYLFELSFLKELNTKRAKIIDVVIPPIYKDEISNLKEWQFFFQVMLYFIPATISRIFLKLLKR